MSKKSNKRESTRRLRRVLNATQEMVTSLPSRSSRFQYGQGMPKNGITRLAVDTDLPLLR